MTDSGEKCRRCLLRESGRQNKEKEILECILRIKEGERADEKLYSQRLSLCRECDFLIDGTCLKCGCYVELRAAFKNNRCPLAGSKNKW